MVDIQSLTAEIRPGKKQKKKTEITGQKYNNLPYYIGQIIINSVHIRDVSHVTVVTKVQPLSTGARLRSANLGCG